MSAAEIRHHLCALQLERLEAESSGLVSNVKSTVVKDRYDAVSQLCTPASQAACTAAGIH
jgi:hypothetical protein